MNDFIQLNFLKKAESGDSNRFYIIFYLLSGESEIIIDGGKVYELGQGDVVVINPLEAYKLNVSGALVAKFMIDGRRLSKMTNDKVKYIECNTVKDHNENFVMLRHLLDQLINSLLEEEHKQLFFQQYSYDLTAFLVSEFSNNIFFDGLLDQRKNEISKYIDLNYQNDIRLDTIASHFALTPPYFSKYFKEKFQTSFLKYVNLIRLENACDELLNSNATILKIALDNGFPNLASFTRVINAAYGCNPTQYRLQNKQKENEIAISFEEVKEHLVHTEKIQVTHAHSICINVETEKEVLNPYWFKLCNLGDISGVLNDGMKEQVQQLQKELKFEFARIYLDKSNPTSLNDFYEEEKAIDFLFENKFKIYLVIDYRKYVGNDSFIFYLRKFILHFINRYGFKNVNLWDFELFYDSEFDHDKAEQYNLFYKKIQGVLHETGYSTNLHGPGLLLDDEGLNLKRFLGKNPLIKSITMSVAPYSVRNKNGEVFINRTTDSNYIFEQYQLAKTICSKFSNIESVSIISWKDQLNDVNIMNDTNYRAARILQNMIKGYHQVTSLAVDKPLDLLISENVDNQIFSGLSGLICRKGVKKPSFYAYKFLRKLDSNFLYKDDVVLTTCSDKKYIQIICHNCKRLNYKFYSKESELIDGSDLSKYYEDEEVLELSFRFENMLNGKYLLKYRSVNEEKGNTLNTWLAMDFESNSFFGNDELDYLKATAIPAISGSVFVVTNGILEFTCHLQANEIRHLHLIYTH